MRINFVGLTTVLVMLAAFYYGCVVVDGRRSFEPGAVLGLTAVEKSKDATGRAKLNRVVVEVEAGQCKASFDKDLDEGKVKAKTTKLLSGSHAECQVDEPPDKLTDLLTIKTKAGVRPIKAISAVQFSYEGTCRYCWGNTNGGMTCVVSPGPCQ